MSRLRAARGSLLEAVRAEPLTAALFIAATLSTLLPVWIGRYVPLLDYPNHLSVTFVWRHLGDPYWNFAPYYTTHLVPLPYWVGYGVVYLLSDFRDRDWRDSAEGPEAIRKLEQAGCEVRLAPCGAAQVLPGLGRDVGGRLS